MLSWGGALVWWYGAGRGEVERGWFLDWQGPRWFSDSMSSASVEEIASSGGFGGSHP